MTASDIINAFCRKQNTKTCSKSNLEKPGKDLEFHRHQTPKMPNLTSNHKQRLDRNRKALVDDLDPKDVVDQLITDGVINGDEEEEVLVEKIRKDRAKKLIQLVRRYYYTATLSAY